MEDTHVTLAGFFDGKEDEEAQKAIHTMRKHRENSLKEIIIGDKILTIDEKMIIREGQGLHAVRKMVETTANSTL